MSHVPSLGPRGEGWLAIQLVLLALVAVGGVLAPRSAGITGGTAGTVVGLVLMVLGGAIAVVGVTALGRGRSMTALPHPRPEGTLVTSGVYARVRHPIYAGLILGALGWSVLLDSWPALLATAALAVVLDLKRRREEAWLLGRFEGYAAYRERTKALIPFLY